MADSIREQCEKRLAGLKAVRQPYEADWEEIAALAAPARPAFLGRQGRKRRATRGLYDGHAIRSFRTLAGGMTSGMSSRSRPWFRITLADRDLAASQDVAEWLSAVEDALYGFLGRTNFYEAAQIGYLELGLYGTEAAVMVEHPSFGGVCHSLAAGEYWIAQSDANRPDTLYRSAPMSVLQVVQAFGLHAVSRKLRELYDTSRYDETVPIFHAIEPNPDAIEGRLDASGKAYRSVWWEEGESDRSRLLRRSGYNEQIFWAPRWVETGGLAVYGDGPGLTALPDMRELQMQAKRKGEAVDWHVKPEIVVPASIHLRRVPGSIVSAPTLDAGAIQIPYQLPYQTIAVIREDLQNCKRAIDTASFADLFLAITNMPGLQPRTIEEIAARNEEKLTQLGPVIERVENEKLSVALDRAFAILLRAQMLPPPPHALAGQALKIEFVSVLAQMQRSIGLGQIQQTLAFAGQLGQLDPGVVDLIDGDAALREYADRSGLPPRILRGAEEVRQMRAARARQMQAQQLAAAVPMMKEGASAIKDLSETDAGGGRSLLQRIGEQIGAQQQAQQGDAPGGGA